MAEERIQRRLAAILAADLVGYSRLMEDDEAGTLNRLKELRRELFVPTTERFGGRIFKVTGDGALAEFPSVVDALNSAVSVQRALADRNARLPENQRIELRVGVSLGDVIVEGDDLYGRGVNVAARMESLAEPGGICISGNVYEQVRGAVGLAFDDLGEQKVKNITSPVRAYRVHLGSSGITEPDRQQVGALPQLPDKPSIAVLPFQNLSGDPNQEYFADGMAEEIITALSLCKSLFVIARNSSFTYKGKAVDVRQVGRELGVRYVLEGSVRRDSERLRFTIQLIDAISGRHIRADRFEGNIGDVFALQDRITESVVAIIEPDVQLAEIERLKHAPAASLDAYELLLRAQQLEFEFTGESLSEAIRCLDRALTLDPCYAQAMALAAHCYSARIHQGWATEPRREMDEALRLAARAVELAKNDANVLWMAAKVVLVIGMDAERAKQLAYASLALNPNSAAALAVTGIIESNSANREKAFELFRRAERLNPRDRRGWGVGAMIAVAHLVDGQFDRAAAIAETTLLQNPRNAVALRALAASFAKMGQGEKAAKVLGELLKIDPNVTISSLRTRIMFMDEGVWQRYADGLRRAGLPE
jgi:TolB-like protein/class 3 adenylate cyclase